MLKLNKVILDKYVGITWCTNCLREDRVIVVFVDVCTHVSLNS